MKSSTAATIASVISAICNATTTTALIALMTHKIKLDPSAPVLSLSNPLTFLAIMAGVALGAIVSACMALEYDREAERLEKARR